MTIGSKSLSLTLSLPEISYSALFTDISEKARHTFNDLSSSSQSAMNSSRNMGRNLFKNKFAIAVGVVVVLLLVIIYLSVHTASTTSVADTRPTIEKPLATQAINKTYSFPIKDTNGKQVSTFKYTIESAELRNEIILNGQRVPTVQGRTMLILNVKLTNDYTKPVSVNARDYIRLTMNGKTTERLAPDIHNDPVDSQSMSTESTRVGFFINDTDKQLVLSVGQYVGDDTSKKDTIKLTLSK